MTKLTLKPGTAIENGGANPDRNLLAVRQKFSHGRTRLVSVIVKGRRPDALAIAQRRLDLDAEQAKAEAQKKAKEAQQRARAEAQQKAKEAQEEARAETQQKAKEAQQKAGAEPQQKARERADRKKERRAASALERAAAKKKRAKKHEDWLRERASAKKARRYENLTKIEQQESARRSRGEIRASTPLEVRRQDRVAQLALQLMKGKFPDRGQVNEELAYLASIDVASWPNVDRERYQFVRAILRSIEEGSSPDIQQPDGKYFRWPETLVGKQTGSGSVVETANEVGVLRSMGYQVGVHGLPSNERRRLLNLIFERELKLALPPAYLSEWGRPGTPTRLRKLAHTIAALTRNMKRRSADAPSIEEWEEDLAYLKQRFYIGRFSFDWPRA